MNEYDSETLVVDGVEVKVTYTYDEDSDPPWENCDGHGLVTGWMRRDKLPCERVLCEDHRGGCNGHGMRRYYDWQEACRRARKEGWNAEPYDAPNRIERAVQNQFDYFKAWCDDEWCYVGVCVSVGTVEDSVWCVETWKDYHKEYAREMAEGLVRSIKREEQERAYWAYRDVLTKEG